MEDKSEVNLDLLIARRNKLLQKKEEILITRRTESLQSSLDRSLETTKNDTSNSVIEGSDVSMESQCSAVKNKHQFNNNIIINSSTDEDIVSTSTVHFPRTHQFFTGEFIKSSTSEVLKPETSTPYNDKVVTEPKVNVISNIQVQMMLDNDRNIVLVAPQDPHNIIMNTFSDNEQVNDFITLDNSINDQSPKSPSVIQPQDLYFEYPIASTSDRYNNIIVTQETKVCSEELNDVEINQMEVSSIVDLPTTSKKVQNDNKKTDSVEDNIESTSIIKKKRATSAFKIACLDFDSDNNSKEDFSPGSSEYWISHGSEDESSDENTVKRKRKQKKKKINIENDIKIIPVKKIKRLNKSKMRKQLRNEGKEYLTSVGSLKKARSVKENPCVEGKCSRKCYEIHESRRLSIFQYFWGLDNQRKKDWIIHCSSAIPVKRKKTKEENSRRHKTYEYFINEGEGRRQVCQQFILKTLDVSQKYLIYTLGNVDGDGLAKLDERKVNVVPKYNEEIHKSARDFIEKLPAVPSHYCRKSSKRLYLPQELKNVSHLYTIYKKQQLQEKKEVLSERLFVNIFKNEYNYSFHVPKKDKCHLCTKKENNPEEVDNTVFVKHMEEKAACKARFHFHQQLHIPGNKVLVASFDLQKVLNTPYGESMLLYYSRKYAVYCFTVYESWTQKGYCFVWGESDGKRGSNEIGTCLYKYLQEVDKRGYCKLLLYCDSCTGQNKNKTILAMFRHFLKTSVNLETIQINYLLPGHTYMPVDSMHATIEKAVQKIIVWAPSQWPSFIECSRKKPGPYIVHVMDHSEFLNFEAVTAETFTKPTLKDKNLRLRDLRIVTFKKKNIEKMEVKYSMVETANVTEILFDSKNIIIDKGKGKGKGKKKSVAKEKVSNIGKPTGINIISINQLYQHRLPVSLKKYNDLKKLCVDGSIPKCYHHEYLKLPYSKATEDKLLQSDNDESTHDEEE